MTISPAHLFKQLSEVLRRCKLILFTINNPFNLNISHLLSISCTTQIIMMIHSSPPLCLVVSMAVIIQGNLFLKGKRMLIGKKSSTIHLPLLPWLCWVSSSLPQIWPILLRNWHPLLCTRNSRSCRNWLYSILSHMDILKVMNQLGIEPRTLLLWYSALTLELPVHIELCSVKVVHQGSGFALYIPTDPVSLLREFVYIWDRIHGTCQALFICEDGSHPTQAWFDSKLFSFLNWSFGSHSARAGGATFYTALGLSKSIIMALGHWSSEAWKIYIHDNPSICTALQLASLHGH